MLSLWLEREIDRNQPRLFTAFQPECGDVIAPARIRLRQPAGQIGKGHRIKAQFDPAIGLTPAEGLALDTRSVATESKLRITHSSPSTPAVDLYLVPAGTDISGVMPDFGGVIFGGATPVLGVAPGNYDILVTLEGSKDPAISVLNVPLTGGEIWTNGSRRRITSTATNFTSGGAGGWAQGDVRWTETDPLTGGRFSRSESHRGDGVVDVTLAHGEGAGTTTAVDLR